MTPAQAHAMVNATGFRVFTYLRIECEPAGQPRAMPVAAGGFARMVMDWKFRTGPRKGEYRPAWHFRQAVKTAAMFEKPGAMTWA